MIGMMPSSRPASSGCRRLLPRAELRVIGVVDKGLLAFGRQLLGVAESTLYVLAPNLARQLVEDLDAVAVGVADIEAVRHAVIDAAVELHTLAAQKGELLEPCLAARHRDRDGIDRNRRLEHVPI